jgi:hypothetical protein
MNLTTDFECGSGKLIRLGENRWRLETCADRFGYNKYFCLRIESAPTDPPVNLELEVVADPALDGRSHFMTHFPSHLWYTDREWNRWVPLRNTWESAVTFEEHSLRIRVPVAPDKAIYLATNPPRRYSDLTRSIAGFTPHDRSPVRIESIGRSFEGRDIPVLRLGREGRPRLLILAGMHSSEHGGVWACEGILRYAASSIAEAQRLIGGLDLAIVPMLNPDGNVHGYSGGNTQRLAINNSLDFDGAADGRQPQTHENAELWRWLETFRPEVFLHFHGYVGWKKFADPPYDGIWAVADLQRFVTDPRRVAAQRAIVDRILFDTAGFSAHWDHVGELTPGTLDYELARAFGTIGVLYEINTGAVGPSQQFRRGPEVFGAVARALLDDTTSFA